MKTVSSRSSIEFDPFSPNFLADPYSFYQYLREEDPIHRSPYGMWVLSRYADVATALRDSRLSSRPSRYSVHSLSNRQRFPAAKIAGHLLPFLDPPDHTRLRRLLAKVITETLVVDIRGRIRQIVNELLNPLVDQGEMDIIKDFANLLPVFVIAEILGIPNQDRRLLKEWSSCFFYIFSPMPSTETYQRLNQAILDFSAYLRELVVHRRRQPQRDVISSLIHVRDELGQLSEDELIATCILLFANGEETLAHLIGNGMLALLKSPAQLRMLRNQPTLIKSAVEELLRYDTPAQVVGRTATEIMRWHGRIIPAGDPVFLLLGSANRDPDRFSDPDRLNITREDNDHLGFGGGRHSCLGAGIARAEAQIAINTLLALTQDIVLVSNTVKWRDSIFIRGVDSLPVRFEKAI